MSIVLWILAIIGFAVICIIVWFLIMSGNEEREERRAYKKQRESAEAIAQVLNDAQYWLVGDDRKNYRELLLFIIERLKTNTWISGESIREKVDEFINKTTHP